MAKGRTAIPVAVRRDVLMEAGYRCAVPTCRTILTIDIHHIIHVSKGGGNEVSNLIALCPTCHALHHKGVISGEAIRSWKGILMAMNHAFDRESIEHLFFLRRVPDEQPLVSGDGVLKFSALIGAGLASFDLKMQNGPLLLYGVRLTPKGAALLSAWEEGERSALENALSLREE